MRGGGAPNKVLMGWKKNQKMTSFPLAFCQSKQICIKYVIYMTVILSLCLIAEGSNCKFWEKNPQVHIMNIKKNNP